MIYELIVIILCIVFLLYKLVEYIQYKIKLNKIKKVHDIDFDHDVSSNIFWRKYKCRKCQNIICEQRTTAHEYGTSSKMEFNGWLENIYECKEKDN